VREPRYRETPVRSLAASALGDILGQSNTP